MTSQEVEGQPTTLSPPGLRPVRGLWIIGRCRLPWLQLPKRSRLLANFSALVPGVGRHWSPTMQPGAALQAMLLAVLLAKPRDSKGRLLSGECASWVEGWCLSTWG